MSIYASPDASEYNFELTKLKKIRDALLPGDALLMPINSVILNVEKMEKNNALSVAELTSGLRAVTSVMAEVNGKNTEKLLDALAQLEQFKSSIANAQFKNHLQYFLTAVALLIISAVIVLAAIQFPPVLLFPTIAFAMGTTAIPGIAGVIPAFTVSSIAMNLLIGAGLGIIRPPVWKYSRDTYRAWRYDAAVAALETTINEKKNASDMEANLASHAKIFLDEIQNIKKMGDKSKGVNKLTEGLDAVNAVLKNPLDIKNLQHIANIAEHYSPLKTPLAKAYELFLASLTPIAAIAVIIAIPAALIQSAGYVAHTLAVQFLGYVVPYSGMGIGPDSAVGFLFINEGISAVGEASVEIPRKTSSIVDHLKTLLSYKKEEKSIALEPPALNQAIKTLKSGLKSRRVKAGVMREKMQEFKDQFNEVAKESDKPMIPLRNKC